MPRAKKQRYVIDVEKIVRYRVEVSATSVAQAETLARQEADQGRGHEAWSFKAVASWPDKEPATLKGPLGDGYTVRRGWFDVLTTTGGKFGERTISFPEGTVEKPDNIFYNVILPPGERVYWLKREYGFAATHESVNTWSKVYKDPKAAYTAARLFMAQQHHFDRDKRRQERQVLEAIRGECRMDAVLERMAAHGERLKHVAGGKWVDEEPSYDADGQPRIYEEKWLIDLLLEKTYVEVVERMNRSGDPRVVQMTPEGFARLEVLRGITAPLRIT